MSEKAPEWAENHQYLLDRGFLFDYSLGQYSRTVEHPDPNYLAIHQHLSCQPSRVDPMVGTWAAVQTSVGNAAYAEQYGTQFCVFHSEGFTSPILAYITAETRLWQRQ